MKLEETQQKLVALAPEAAAGDRKAEAALAAGITALSAERRSKDTYGGPGTALSAVFAALCSASRAPAEPLRRLLPALLAGIVKHGESHSVPYEFRPAKLLGPEALAPVAEALHGALARCPSEEVAAYGGNPSNVRGFSVAEHLLERLFEYAQHAPQVAHALGALEWTSESLGLFARALENLALLKMKSAPAATTARAVLPSFAQRTAGLTGEGARKLREYLVRNKVLSRKDAGGAKPSSLPRMLPQRVKQSLAMLGPLGLTPADVKAGSPATTAQLAALEKWLGRKLPTEVVALYRAHGTLGDREVQGPAAARGLHRELLASIREHEKEDPSSPRGKGEYDVRGFGPEKRALPLGTDATGDTFFLALGARGRWGSEPVVRFHHGEALVATVEAETLGEFVALLVLEPYAQREGLTAELDKLRRRARKIRSGYKKPAAKKPAVKKPAAKKPARREKAC